MRTVRLGDTSYPLVLPSARDPRLHLAAVIISVHILGQTVLDFRVSVPQILSAILICALIEVVWTLVRQRQIVWPASAMLTGSGVALILRLVGMERGQHWSWQGWHLFALVAGASLLSKYLIRYQGVHLFNPSNLGLVAAFLLLGSSVIEPLDFWWALWSPGLIAAYLIIVIGGLIITARLKLLSLASTFWVSLALGLGLLAATGHCITAAWAITPVCGFDFWRVVMTSPELLIFLFFMITDPKTIPSRSSSRIVFAALLGITCTLLMASQVTEFGAKVGLLGGLVALTPLRFALDRYLERSPSLLAAPPRRSFAGGTAIGATTVVLAATIVAAGIPARGEPVSLATSQSVNIAIDASSLPDVQVSADVAALNSEAASRPSELAIDLAENLAVENEAMLKADTSILRSVSDGVRLLTMEREIEAAAARGEYVVSEYAFEGLALDVEHANGPQGGASLAMEAVGTVTTITYDTEGNELERSSLPFASIFVLSPGTGDHWLITDTVDPG